MEKSFLIKDIINRLWADTGFFFSDTQKKKDKVYTTAKETHIFTVFYFIKNNDILLFT